MKFGARLLTAVAGVNSYGFTPAVEASAGDAVDVYLQLVDLSQHTAQQGYQPVGLRYLPADGAVLTVQVQSLDNAKQLTRVATKPFPQDASIWKFSLLATDPARGTVSLRLTLTEGTVVRTAQLPGALRLDGSMEIC